MRRWCGLIVVGGLAMLMWSNLSAQTPGRAVGAGEPVTQSGRRPQVVPVQFGIIQRVAAAASEGEQEGEESGSPQIAEEIRQRLHEPVSITLDLVPLKDALHELLAQRKIDHWIDEVALVEAGKKLEEIAVKCELHNVSIRAALDRICRPAGLGWVCEDSGIHITTRKTAASIRFHRIYDVTPLLPDPEIKVEEVPPQKLSEPVSHPEKGASRSVRPAQFFGQPVSAVPDGGVATRNPSDELIELVQGVTGGAPEHPWVEADGEGGAIYLMRTPHMKLLVIRQNESTHGEIERLLNELTSHQHAAMDESESSSEPAAPKEASRKVVRSPVRIVGKRRSR